jgi:photosystem II stability/assembly factor-like uncharacterized protein
MKQSMMLLNHRRAVVALAACVTLPAFAGKVTPALERPALVVARPAASVLLAVTRAGNRLVAAGERGLVIVSDDSGKSWAQAKVPVSVTLTALRFKDRRQGWAVGNMGVVLRTADGGASWERVFDGRAAAKLAQQAAQAAWDAGKPDPNNLEHPLNLALENAERLVAEGADKPLLAVTLGEDGTLHTIGAYGLAFASTDGGRHWQARMDGLPNPEGLSFNGLVEWAGGHLLFGEQGLLLHAAKPGAPFQAQPFPSKASLFGAVPLKSGALLLLGLRGKVFRIAKAGGPWTEIQTPVDASLFTGLELQDNTVMLLGAAGQVLASRDQGQTFTALPMKTRFPFTGAAIAPDGTVILAGTRGVLRVPVDQTVTTSNRMTNHTTNGKL